MLVEMLCCLFTLLVSWRSITITYISRQVFFIIPTAEQNNWRLQHLARREYRLPYTKGLPKLWGVCASEHCIRILKVTVINLKRNMMQVSFALFLFADGRMPRKWRAADLDMMIQVPPTQNYCKRYKNGSGYHFKVTELHARFLTFCL